MPRSPLSCAPKNRERRLPSSSGFHKNREGRVPYFPGRCEGYSDPRTAGKATFPTLRRPEEQGRWRSLLSRRRCNLPRGVRSFAAARRAWTMTRRVCRQPSGDRGAKISFSVAGEASILRKTASRQLRRSLEAEAKMPVAPRACIEDAGGRIRQNIAQGAVGKVTLDDDQTLDGAVGHHLGEEAIRVRDGFGGFLPSEEPLGDLFQVGHKSLRGSVNKMAFFTDPIRSRNPNRSAAEALATDSSASLLYRQSPVFQGQPQIVEVPCIARHQNCVMLAGQRSEQKV